eukprot:TRINITY_DN2039_c0_g2_i1.p1 TRINITY_DN2039_c0_g2~~TRINITY_DN2039_c0_g2_i1.p1  ORF type:complete len:930 (-),score=156.26 TRINITY_DN2039_c0_g2_i1:465-3254(-)
MSDSLSRIRSFELTRDQRKFLVTFFCRLVFILKYSSSIASSSMSEQLKPKPAKQPGYDQISPSERNLEASHPHRKASVPIAVRDPYVQIAPSRHNAESADTPPAPAAEKPIPAPPRYRAKQKKSRGRAPSELSGETPVSKTTVKASEYTKYGDSPPPASAIPRRTAPVSSTPQYAKYAEPESGRRVAVPEDAGYASYAQSYSNWGAPAPPTTAFMRHVLPAPAVQSDKHQPTQVSTAREDPGYVQVLPSAHNDALSGTTAVPSAVSFLAPPPAPTVPFSKPITGLRYIQLNPTAQAGDGFSRIGGDSRVGYIQFGKRPKKGGETGPMVSGDFIIHMCDVDLSDDVLGKGAFGSVGAGLWRGVAVAVKQILVSHESDDLEDEIQSLVREVAVVATLRHPHIVAYFGCILKPTLSLVQELLSGSLRSALDSEPFKFSYDRIINTASGIARGLWYLHEHRPHVLHLDLSSANVLLAVDGSAKVADFGLSRVLHGTSGEFSQMSQVRYAAPELMQGKNVGPKADIFSFGVVLWEMLTLERPWCDRHDDFQLARDIIDGFVLPAPIVSHHTFVCLLRDCFALDQDSRPRARDLVARLEDIRSAVKDEAERPVMNGLTMNAIYAAHGAKLRNIVRVVIARRKLTIAAFAKLADLSEDALAAWFFSDSDVETDDSDLIRSALERLAEDATASAGAQRTKKMSLDKLTALCDAIKELSSSIIKSIVAQGFDLNGTASMRPLHVACECGDITAVDLLLQNGAHMELSNAAGRTPLAVAARAGRADICALLLQFGANVNARDNQRLTVLMLVCGTKVRKMKGSKGKMAEVVELLLSSEALELNATGASGNTALHIAVETSRRTTRRLLQQANINVYVQNDAGETPADVLRKTRLFPELLRELQLYEKAHPAGALPRAIARLPVRAPLASRTSADSAGQA